MEILIEEEEVQPMIEAIEKDAAEPIGCMVPDTSNEQTGTKEAVIGMKIIYLHI